MRTVYGQTAYEAYVESCGGVSVRGEPLPAWDEQLAAIREHWDKAAGAVVDHYLRDCHG